MSVSIFFTQQTGLVYCLPLYFKPRLLIVIMGATDSKLAFRKGVFRLFEQRVRLLHCNTFYYLFMPISIERTKDGR